MNPREFYNKTADVYEERQRSPWFRLIRKKEEEIIKKFAEGYVVDLGCGTGYHLKSASLGIDISEEMLKGAKKFRKPLLLADGENLPLKSESVDTILCMFSVLNLCNDYKKMASEMKRILRPGGRLILSVTSIYDQGLSLAEKKKLNTDIVEKRFSVAKVPYRMVLFSKDFLEGLFDGMKLVHFNSLYEKVIPRWGEWKGLSEREMEMIDKEKPSKYGCMYFMVFEKA